MIRSLLLFPLHFVQFCWVFYLKKFDLKIISCIDQAILLILHLDSNLIALFVSNSKSLDSKNSVSNQNSTVDWILMSGMSRQTHKHLTDSFIYKKGKVMKPYYFMRGRSYSNGVSYLILVAKEGDLFIDRMSSEYVSERNVFEAFFLSNVIICNTKITNQFRITNASCRAMRRRRLLEISPSQTKLN